MKDYEFLKHLPKNAADELLYGKTPVPEKMLDWFEKRYLNSRKTEEEAISEAIKFAINGNDCDNFLCGTKPVKQQIKESLKHYKHNKECVLQLYSYTDDNGELKFCEGPTDAYLNHIVTYD